jgi:hypothetical protein
VQEAKGQAWRCWKCREARIAKGKEEVGVVKRRLRERSIELQEKQKKENTFSSRRLNPTLLSVGRGNRREGRMEVERKQCVEPAREEKCKEEREKGKKKVSHHKVVGRSNIFVEHATGHIGRQIQVCRRCS